MFESRPEGALESVLESSTCKTHLFPALLLDPPVPTPIETLPMEPLLLHIRLGCKVIANKCHALGLLINNGGRSNCNVETILPRLVATRKKLPITSQCNSRNTAVQQVNDNKGMTSRVAPSAAELLPLDDGIDAMDDGSVYGVVMGRALLMGRRTQVENVKLFPGNLAVSPNCAVRWAGCNGAAGTGVIVAPALSRFTGGGVALAIHCSRNGNDDAVKPKAKWGTDVCMGDPSMSLTISRRNCRPRNDMLFSTPPPPPPPPPPTEDPVIASSR